MLQRPAIHSTQTHAPQARSDLSTLPIAQQRPNYIAGAIRARERDFVSSAFAEAHALSGMQPRRQAEEV